MRLQKQRLVVGKECRDSRGREWVMLDVPVGPLSGQNRGLESRVWET